MVREVITSALSPTNRAPAESAPAAPPPAPPSSPPLARYLVALVAAAIVPLLVVASVLIWRQGTDERASTEAGLQSTTHALSVAVDRQLLSYRRVLEALALSDMIDRGDFRAMHAYAGRVAEVKGAIFISMFEPGGRQVFNTALPFGAPLPDPFRDAVPAAGDALPVGDTTSLRRVFRTGKPSTSDLFVGLAARRTMFTVDVPVVRDGRVVYALNAAFPAELVTQLLTQDEDLSHARSMVVDGRGFVVGRWQDAQKYTGTRVHADTLAMLRSSQPEPAVVRTLDGEYVFRAAARSRVNDWVTLVSVDASQLRREQQGTWLIWGSAALVALLLSLLVAARLAGRLAHSIGNLAAAASTDAAPGDYGLPSRELDRLRDALVEAKESRAGALRALETALTAEARRTEAEAANREKDRFMAAVVHELRTPLAALSNVAALLKAGVADERVTGIVERQVGQLARLADDLLETSRVNFGKFSLQLAPLDLREVVRQAVEATATRHDHRRHAVALALPDDAVTVQGDRARLTQVIANLVDNAMKFTPAGGAIRIGLETHVGHAVLSVADSGPGIDPQFLPHVFDRFVQQPGTSTASEGLGLGLAVARDLVLAHNGRIEAASEGEGARFTVTLPLAAPES